MSSPFLNTVHNFRAGNICRKVDRWLKLSGDPWVIATVQGADIPLEDLPVQERVPYPFRLSDFEKGIMEQELGKLLAKGVIEETAPVQGQVISNVFLRPKASGGFRVILDLTDFNKNVEYEHFKMTTLQTALSMLRPNCWMGSVDLRDAYYSVPMAQGFRKFLRFVWNGRLFQYVGMPNGLSSAPRTFTKLLAPVYAELRVGGHECFPYIDDSFVVSG